MSNPHDVYAIAAKKRLPGFLPESIVGHLPREVSRTTHYFMVEGYPVDLLGDHH